MTGHFVRKEILDHILSLRFLILAAVGALAIGMSLFDGYANYRARMEDYSVAQAATGERIQHLMGVDSWPELGTNGYWAHRRPTPLSIFVRGLEPTLGRSAQVGFGKPARLRRSPASVQPVLGFFPPLDLAQVVQVVLSLFVLLFTFDAVCGEKEAGTLRLVSSFTAPRSSLLLGKLLGALMPSFAAFGLPLLLGLAVMLAATDVQLSGSELLRLALILACFAVYLTAITTIGLFASSLVHRPATSFVLLLIFWSVTVTVLPRLSLVVAESVRPSPSFFQLQAEKAAFSSDVLKRRNEGMGQWAQAYQEKNGERPGTSQAGREAATLEYARTRKEGHAITRPAWARLEERYKNRFSARADLAVALARFSPAFALKNATLLIAGTGMAPPQRFMAAHALHRIRFADWYGDTKTRDWLRRANADKYGEYTWDVSDLPRLVPPEEWRTADLETALADLAVLAAWAMLFFAGAYVAMLRYDLR